jgi:3-keto-disaccharide hydrolase
MLSLQGRDEPLGFDSPSGKGDSVPVNLHRLLTVTLAGLAFVLFRQQAFLQAENRVWNFDKDNAQSLLQGWLFAVTGQGTKGTWGVLAEPSAPSQPNVLAQTSKDITDYRFPVAIVQNVDYQDPSLNVQFKTISGRVDQSAGLVWRYQDSKNYYVVRANALEDNVVLYKIESGKRSHLRPKGATGRGYGVKISVPRNAWNKLGVKVSGNVFVVSFNGQKLFEVEDNTFAERGKIGLWTKSDSVTCFDNLSVSGK